MEYIKYEQKKLFFFLQSTLLANFMPVIHYKNHTLLLQFFSPIAGVHYA